MFFFFFFNDTATTEIYTLSLHDALPICSQRIQISFIQRIHLDDVRGTAFGLRRFEQHWQRAESRDRKSTRLNSSHGYISYAVFCLKKKKKTMIHSVYMHICNQQCLVDQD